MRKQPDTDSGGGCGEYRGFRIDYAPPPIPARECDWQWVHEDYDGPEDNRCGHAPSLEAAKADIDFWHEENGDAG